MPSAVLAGIAWCFDIRRHKWCLGPVVMNHIFLFFLKVESLSADSLVTLLECKLPNSNSYPIETWKAFFAKVAGVLDEALVRYSDKVDVVLQSYPTPLHHLRAWL